MKKSKSDVRSTLKTCITKIDAELMNNAYIDSENSGSTWCITLIHNKTIYFGNTGDSRALLVTFNTDPLSKTFEK